MTGSERNCGGPLGLGDSNFRCHSELPVRRSLGRGSFVKVWYTTDGGSTVVAGVTILCLPLMNARKRDLLAWCQGVVARSGMTRGTCRSSVAAKIAVASSSTAPTSAVMCTPDT